LVSNLNIQDESIAEYFAENGLLTQARLILLDSPLMIMTAFTGLAFTSFTNQHEQGPTKAFQPTWWFWLAMTGLGLGATVSVKWVGLFTIAWVGSLTVLQLWILLGDVKTVTPVSCTLIPNEYPANHSSVFSRST
jgi:dolichyl-phosphate-mannose-protein mannosyltransferase